MHLTSPRERYPSVDSPLKEDILAKSTVSFFLLKIDDEIYRTDKRDSNEDEYEEIM